MENIYTVLKFKAPWCSPCKSLAKTLDSVLPEFSNIKVEEIDIDEDVEKSREYKIRSIPTIVMIKDGEEIDRLIGNQTAEQIKKFLKR